MLQKNDDIRNKVRTDYNTIAEHFSETRSAPWPEFRFFEEYLRDGDSLLDLGCGNGRVYEFLQKGEKDVRYTGLDFSEKLIEQGRKKYPDAAFVVSDMTELPFKEESFDHVWAIASFHHLPTRELRKRCLDEIQRVLKPGGYFIMTCWSLFQKKYRSAFLKNWKYLLKADLERFSDLQIPWKNQSGETLAERYYHAFTPRRLCKLVQESGFEIVDEFYSLKDKKVNFFKSHNICIVAKKSV